jgi:thioredoxin reductase
MWDCLIIGGGAAGLSAALVLGRARRKTLLVDAGEPSNRFTDAIGGVLGQDGRAPADFYAAGRRELAKYPSVEVRHGEVTAGDREQARTVLLATGMDYRYPDIPGVAERWGRSVFHCPFCHGWEHREQPLGVYGDGPDAEHRLQLLKAWSDDVSHYPSLKEVRDGAVVLEDGSERECGGLLVPVTLYQRSSLAADLGASFEEPNPMTAEALTVDFTLQTTAPGVYAAGDVTPGPPSVPKSIQQGAWAAAMIVRDLTSTM